VDEEPFQGIIPGTVWKGQHPAQDGTVSTACVSSLESSQANVELPLGELGEIHVQLSNQGKV
jgi:hypothetical protein